MGFGENPYHFPDYVITGHIPPFKEGDNRFLVTGCSANHFISAAPAMLAGLNASATMNIAFIDYGITNKQLKELASVFEYIHKVHLAMHSPSKIVYRKFNFHNAPSWMNIANRATVGGYSWKVIAYMDVLFDWQALVGWIDAGSIIYDGVNVEFGYAKKEGMYVPSSPGDVKRWTHPATIEFIEKTGMVKKVNRKGKNCSAGHIFLDFTNKTAVEMIFKPFIQCAYTMKCITPKGSTRKNHRQDQAVITILLHNAHLKYSAAARYHHGAKFRQERLDKKKIRVLVRTLKKEIERRNRIVVSIVCSILKGSYIALVILPFRPKPTSENGVCHSMAIA